MTRHAASMTRLRLGLAGAALLGILARSHPAAAGPHVDPNAKPECRRTETPVAKQASGATAPTPACSRSAPVKPKQAKAPTPPEGQPLPFFGPRGALAPHVV